ncbi:MAG: DNA-processing protein DprA [bacterium JZ-2024 1]
MNERESALLLKYAGFPEKEIHKGWEQGFSFRSMWENRKEFFSRIPLHCEMDEEKIFRQLEKKKISFLIPGEEGYPEPLKHLNPIPFVIFYQGTLPANWEKALGVVGTRRPSGYGRSVARNFAQKLASCDILIVSGLARGIDAEAHLGALDANKPTVAVLGCGIDVVYPSEHRFLYQKIQQQGCLLSTFLPGASPEFYHFPERNRILAGLCRGVLLVEAPMKSGALITARWAADLGKDVFAIPGRIDSPTSQGCLYFIQNGASLVRHPNDILSAWNLPSLTEELPQEISPEEEKVLQVMGNDPIHLEEISEKLGIPTGATISLLTILEMKGMVQRQPGGFFLRLQWH